MLPSDPGVFDYGLHNRLLVCPWHKREFDIETGECMYVDSHLRLVKYPIRVQNGKVLLELFSIPPETTGQVPSLPKRRAEQS
jgi:nitrite reductase/ring-hydroxylating ferredoxin subunit